MAATGRPIRTKGRLPEEDRQMLADLGLELVREERGRAAGWGETIT